MQTCWIHSAVCSRLYSFFFFNDTATTEIYSLSLHDALPILGRGEHEAEWAPSCVHSTQSSSFPGLRARARRRVRPRSEEHTSELQSESNLVCRLLLEKKKKKNY